MFIEIDESPRSGIEPKTVSEPPRESASDGSPVLLAETPDGRHRYLLVFRFLLTNLVGSALLGAAYMHGLIDRVLAADATRLSLVILGVFLIGLALTGIRVWRTSRELNWVHEGQLPARSHAGRYLAAARGRDSQSRASLASALRLKLSPGLGQIRYLADSLVLLGLIGTVIGFIIAFSGVDAGEAADVDQVSSMIGTLIAGMSVALYTTLVGAVLHVWLMINYRLLASGTAKLVGAVVEAGESRA